MTSTAGPAGKKQPYPFWLGGMAAASAASITHPLDLTRVRAQTATVKQGMLRTIVGSVQSEGILTLWWGLTATWARQLTYSITRFLVYEEAKRAISPDRPPAAAQLALCAAGAGAVAGAVGNPAEIVLTRMFSDLNKPQTNRYNYGNALTGIYRITREEGLATMGRGLGPNIVRSVFMNVGQLAGYDASKQLLLSITSLQDGATLQGLASLMAGTMAQTIVNPVDVVKSRVQNSTVKLSVGSVITNAIRNDGPLVFFRGWLPAWMRLQPQTTILFYFFEFYKKLIDESRAKKQQQLATRVAA